MIEGIVLKYFEIISEDSSGYVGFFRGNPHEDARRLQNELAMHSIYANIHNIGDAYRITLFKGENEKNSANINIILFIATIFTTLMAGSFNVGKNPFSNPLNLIYGWPFSLSLLLILGIHEMGHFLASKYYHIKATLPYFLPIPHPLIGTMGAFIKIKSPITHKDALVRIGAMGPIAGFIVAVPVTIIGLLLSHPVPAAHQEGLRLGNSILFAILTKIVTGTLPANVDIRLHPVAFAGWLGLFVTSLNLLPVGQLDGGHIIYGLFEKHSKSIAKIFFLVLIPLGLLWPGWWFWAFLLLLLGINHPPILNSVTPLNKGSKFIGYTAIIIFILTFMPAPFRV